MVVRTAATATMMTYSGCFTNQEDSAPAGYRERNPAQRGRSGDNDDAKRIHPPAPGSQCAGHGFRGDTDKYRT